MWFLGRDPATGLAFVRHEANTPSGGQVTNMDIGTFLSEPRHPQHEALLRLIGGLIPDRRQTGTHDNHSVVDTGKEWSNAELFELGNMLVKGLSIEEIARLLRRRGRRQGRRDRPGVPVRDGSAKTAFKAGRGSCGLQVSSKLSTQSEYFCA
jgi:hypothetical protein